MKMHFLAGGRLRMRRSIYSPGAPKDETFELPVHAALIRHSQGNVLFDSGCSPEAATKPDERWGALCRAMTPIFEPEQTVVAQLGKVDLEPDDIDVVICSHLHPDHCGCNEHFRRATIFCHADELAAARADGAEKVGYLRKDWDQPQGFQSFDRQHDLFDDERIVLLPMPGHTPGMTVARVTLDRDGAFLLASDAAPLRANLERQEVPRNSWDTAKAAKSLAEIRRIETIGDTVIFGHDDGQWRGLRQGAEFYE
jgi:glyoxylase-like metal-dependent hydrolase (beta-lactamase superfamily II)